VDLVAADHTAAGLIAALLDRFGSATGSP